MASFRAITDLQTNLTHATNGILASNLTNFSERPKVMIENRDGSDSSGSKVSGIVNLITELYNGKRIAGVYRDERYVISATYKVAGQQGDNNAKQVLEEIDRVLEAYNETAGHEYFYEFSYEKISVDGTDLLEFEIDFVLTKTVDVTA